MVILRKVFLTVLAVFAFVGLARVVPYDATGSDDAEQLSEGRRSVPSSQPAPVPAGGSSTEMDFLGLPVGMEQARAVPCRPGLWDPLAEGLCRGECQPLSREDVGGVATVAWMERNPGSGPSSAQALHTAVRDCSAGEATGRLYHLWTYPGLEPGRMLAATGKPEPPRPVPTLPAAEQVAHLDTSGWSIFVDRPRFAEVAVEQAALGYLDRGWSAPPGSGTAAAEDAPETRVFVRGLELCIVTLKNDHDEDLLITACQLRASEEPT